MPQRSLTLAIVVLVYISTSAFRESAEAFIICVVMIYFSKIGVLNQETPWDALSI